MATQEQTTELARQMQAMGEQLSAQFASQFQSMNDQLKVLAQENQMLKDNVGQREAHQQMVEQSLREDMSRLAQEASQRTSQSQGGGHGDTALVSKWAPDNFSGKDEHWRNFSTKFRSFVGAMRQGQVGTWMDWAKSNREDRKSVV